MSISNVRRLFRLKDRTKKALYLFEVLERATRPPEENRLIILALWLPSSIAMPPRAISRPSKTGFLCRGQFHLARPCSYSMHHRRSGCNAESNCTRACNSRCAQSARFKACTMPRGRSDRRRGVPPSITAVVATRWRFSTKYALRLSVYRRAYTNLYAPRKRENNRRRFAPLKYQPRHYRERPSVRPVVRDLRFYHYEIMSSRSDVRTVC